MRYVLPLVLALAGCAGPTARDVWVQPGVTAFQADRTVFGCTRQARGLFPERRVIETAPTGLIGVGVGNRGTSTRIGAGLIIYDVDRNEGPRDASFYSCMTQAGYQLVTLPACAGGPVTLLETQPADVRGLCVANGRLAAPR